MIYVSLVVQDDVDFAAVIYHTRFYVFEKFAIPYYFSEYGWRVDVSQDVFVGFHEVV